MLNVIGSLATNGLRSSSQGPLRIFLRNYGAIHITDMYDTDTPIAQIVPVTSSQSGLVMYELYWQGVLLGLFDSVTEAFTHFQTFHRDLVIEINNLNK